MDNTHLDAAFACLDTPADHLPDDPASATTTTTPVIPDQLNLEGWEAALDALKPHVNEHGGIDRERLDVAVVDAVVAYARKAVRRASQLDSLEVNAEAGILLATLLRQLRGKVTAPCASDETSKGLPEGLKWTSPTKYDLAYRERVCKVAVRALLDPESPTPWHVYTPALPHTPNPRRFLELCRGLYPNVLDAASAANETRTFLENLHNSCHTPGARHEQKIYYLFSHRDGGTGKGTLLGCIGDALTDLGVGVGYTEFADGWVEPSIGLHTVTVVEEWTPGSIPLNTLNNIVDRRPFRYNLKGSATGTARSETTLAAASNAEVWAGNIRRWGKIEYLPVQLKALAKSLSDEQWALYFPFSPRVDGVVDINRDAIIAAVKELVAVCPFRSEHPDWERPAYNLPEDSDLWAGEGELTVVSRRWSDILERINHTVDCILDESARARFFASIGKPMSNDYMYLCNTLDKIRPSEFIRPLSFYNRLSAADEKQAKADLLGLLTELYGAGRLSYHGAGDLWRARIDIAAFNRISAGTPTSDVGDTDPLADTHAQWGALIAAEPAEPATSEE